MADQRKGKMGPWISSASHDGNAQFAAISIGTTSSGNLKLDSRFTLAKPETNPHGPMLLRNPHATAKLYFRMDGIAATASDTAAFRLDPGESIMIPSGVADIRIISDTASTPVAMILYY